MADILQKVFQHLEQQLPFVVYTKPYSTDLKGYFQHNNERHEVINFTEKGFLFADFNGSPPILFPEHFCEILLEKYIFDEKEFDSEQMMLSSDGKAAFEAMVEKAIIAIEEGNFAKVVLSRKETVAFPEIDCIAIFRKMLSLYPSAFRYCWYHPEIGMWIGATPEQLLQVENLKLKTVALAGTQKWQPQQAPIWEKKERQEQQFVTDFIFETLQNETITLHKTAPYSLQAGNVVHLKTDIEGILKSDFSLKKMIEILHPTPAVCGLPKIAAKAFIAENEGFDRKFYAGFLGEINQNELNDKASKTDLFVNLRCMEIQQNQVYLYIGCGITKDSNSKKEYIETVNKAVTMKQILK